MPSENPSGSKKTSALELPGVAAKTANKASLSFLPSDILKCRATKNPTAPMDFFLGNEAWKFGAGCFYQHLKRASLRTKRSASLWSLFEPTPRVTQKTEPMYSTLRLLVYEPPFKLGLKGSHQELHQLVGPSALTKKGPRNPPGGALTSTRRWYRAAGPGARPDVPMPKGKVAMNWSLQSTLRGGVSRWQQGT